MTLGEREAGPSPILVTRSSTTQVTTADVLPRKGTAYPWCVQALVPAIVATGDAKIIFWSDNEPAIFDLKRQAAVECRVRHRMIVIIDDTTEYKSQDNGLTEMAVREIKGVARSARVALSELYKKVISSKHLVLPWLVSYAAGQITRGRIGAGGLTPHQRLKGRAFRKPLPVFAKSVLNLPVGKRASRLPERWSDGFFLGVVERSSEFTLAPYSASCELEVRDGDHWKKEQMWSSLTSSWVCPGNRSPETRIRQRCRPRFRQNRLPKEMVCLTVLMQSMVRQGGRT